MYQRRITTRANENTKTMNNFETSSIETKVHYPNNKKNFVIRQTREV